MNLTKISKNSSCAFDSPRMKCAKCLALDLAKLRLIVMEGKFINGIVLRKLTVDRDFGLLLYHEYEAKQR